MRNTFNREFTNRYPPVSLLHLQETFCNLTSQAFAF